MSVIKLEKTETGERVAYLSAMQRPSSSGQGGGSTQVGEVLLTSDFTGLEWEDRLILIQDWIHDLQELYRIEREGSIG